jgi:uncharacterized SAM-binding protein YcdF (DUF218 family)
MRYAATWQLWTRCSSATLMIDEAPGYAVETERVARVVRRTRVLRVLVLLLISWPLLAWAAARLLILRADLPEADVVVVLGGSSTYLERTRAASQIFKAGRAQKIILTNDGKQGGWSNEEQRNPFFVERAAKELEESGVPAVKIEILPQLVTSTYDEARLLKEYAASHRLRSVLIVTSAYHSRRALWTLRRVFEGSGVELGLESPPTGWQTPAPATWWLHAPGWQLVAGEYVKLAYYHVRY